LNTTPELLFLVAVFPVQPGRDVMTTRLLLEFDYVTLLLLLLLGAGCNGETGTRPLFKYLHELLSTK
jgi:hypothetical protein